MSYFDFPSWAHKALAGKPTEPSVQPMPAPSLDEIEAMQAHLKRLPKSAEQPPEPRKPGRPRKDT